ncbi:MAG: PAS domain-containing sensor histidine kinase [Chloroflexi bacterium]|nr:PAS domain-containing sensor histidine kinase [Chloroflexota bacterium]
MSDQPAASDSAASTNLQTALNAEVAFGLRPTVTGLGFLYLLFSIAHALVLPAPIKLPMVIVALSSVIFFGFWWWRLQSWQPSPELTHPLATLFIVVGGFNSILHIWLSGETHQSTNIAFILIGTGCLLLSWNWFIVASGAILLAWIAAIISLPTSPLTMHFIFMVVSATIAAATIQGIRLRTVKGLIKLRLQESTYKQELQEALIQIKMSEERFRALAEATSEGVVLQDEGVVMDANERFGEMFGYHRDEILGHSLREFVEPQSLQRAMQKYKDGAPYEVTALRKDGSTFIALVLGTNLPYSNRVVRVAAVRDITEQRHFENLLLTAKDDAEAANRAKSTFLSTVSHELRTPLNAIVGYSEMIYEDLIDRSMPELAMDMTRIRSASDRLLSLIDGVLTITDLDAEVVRLEYETIDLALAIGSISDQLQAKAQDNKNTVQLLGSQNWGSIISDDHKLRMIIYHLLDNAIKFTHAGLISISVQRLQHAAGGWLEIAIRDTGIGIAHEQFERIFEPFVQADSSATRQYEGTGLGLAVSMRLARALGGTIELDSRLGIGSTFTLHMPEHPTKPNLPSPQMSHANV